MSRKEKESLVKYDTPILVSTSAGKAAAQTAPPQLREVKQPA